MRAAAARYFFEAQVALFSGMHLNGDGRLEGEAVCKLEAVPDVCRKAITQGKPASFAKKNIAAHLPASHKALGFDGFGFDSQFLAQCPLSEGQT